MADQSSFNLSAQASGPVKCLGQTFSSDQERREHFVELLKGRLKDPEFRSIDGFPTGSDDAILALSDPPYYTACPNPWLGDFVRHFGTPYETKKLYHREPFAADVSEGKNHPIYNAHSYHTKVPHRAIMRYILHYTEPGQVVMDAFCGTGMTGIAAELCGDRNEVHALGYRVQEDGSILDEAGRVFSKLGARRCILNDLAPAATFIAANYNTPVDIAAFEHEAKSILAEVERELGWMYETNHGKTKYRGRINFTVWSDVFNCPECASEIIFWDAALDEEKGGVLDTFKCPSCSASLTKRECSRAWENSFDPSLGEAIKQAKQVPVAINYTYDGKRFEKRPDDQDLETISQAKDLSANSWFPTNRMMDGGETRRNDPDGLTHVHHFYSARNRAVLALFWEKIQKRMRSCPTLGLWFTSSHVWATRQNRLLVSNYFGKKGGVIGQTLQGTLYVSSIGVETNAIERFGLRIESVPHTARSRAAMINTGSASSLSIPNETIDYLFIDPPFGANIAYSELNYLWESWLRVFTNIGAEAIENRPHGKTLSDYHHLMRKCFSECYRVLKPGRWVTVEFSNTQASVWNSIQSALSEVGFVIANVSVLEKEHKGFRAVTTPTAVKQDLVISAYKPNGGLEERFAKTFSSADGVWDFVKTHLRNLPVVKARGGQMEPIAERDPRILYDRMVAFYVRHSVAVPLSSSEFQAELPQNFVERDGMWFLPEQVNEYDKKRAQMENVGQLSIFVEDEKSAISWLRNFLKERPSTYNDVQPDFMQQLNASWKKWEARPELKVLLDQNFICYDGTGEVPSQIHSYLSTQFKELRNLPKDHAQLRQKAKDRWYVPDPKKNVDVETLRNKRLLEEFWSYLPDGYISAARSPDRNPTLPMPEVPRSKKLKQVRTEAVRVGFKFCYQQKDYPTILAVADMLPESVLNEDEQLQMIYDNAALRAEAAT
jgi:hypothetical protein